MHSELNQEADHMTHVARESGTTWNYFVVQMERRIEAVRKFFDGGASVEWSVQNNNKVSVSARGSNCLKN